MNQRQSMLFAYVRAPEPSDIVPSKTRAAGTQSQEIRRAVHELAAVASTWYDVAVASHVNVAGPTGTVLYETLHDVHCV